MSIVTTNTEEGQEFTGRPKKISWERLWTFSGGPFSNTGWPKKNVHTDLDFAKEVGFPNAAASGTQHQGYLVQLMIDLFGVKWLYNGTMEFKNIGLVEHGDTVVAKAVVKSREAQEGEIKFTMDVWVENQDGKKALAGIATGIVSD